MDVLKGNIFLVIWLISFVWFIRAFPRQHLKVEVFFYCPPEYWAS